MATQDGVGVAAGLKVCDQLTVRDGGAMARQLRCGDVLPGCDEVIEGQTDEEVMTKAAEHAKSMHNMTTVTPDFAAKVKAAIRNKG